MPHRWWFWFQIWIKFKCLLHIHQWTTKLMKFSHADANMYQFKLDAWRLLIWEISQLELVHECTSVFHRKITLIDSVFSEIFSFIILQLNTQQLIMKGKLEKTLAPIITSFCYLYSFNSIQVRFHLVVNLSKLILLSFYLEMGVWMGKMVEWRISWRVWRRGF